MDKKEIQREHMPKVQDILNSKKSKKEKASDIHDYNRDMELRSSNGALDYSKLMFPKEIEFILSCREKVQRS